MIITVSELTHFGGLAKVLTRQQTENGALSNTATLSPLTTQYSKQKLQIWKSENAVLKILTIESFRDEDTGQFYKEICDKPIIDFEMDLPFGYFSENIAWRTTIWDFAIHRSLEIWPKMSKLSLERSLGGLTPAANKSLSGKLGSGNRKHFKKSDNDIWEFLSFKTSKYHKTFKPFTEEAKQKCQTRARAISSGTMKP